MGKIEITTEDANFLIQCMDLALRKEGLSLAQKVVELSSKIKNSFEEENS